MGHSTNSIMTDLTLDIAPVLSTPDFVVRPLVPVTLALPSIEGKIFDPYTTTCQTKFE